MHWHPNADEWAYFLKGTARMTVFNTGPAAMTADFHPATSADALRQIQDRSTRRRFA
jgi:oxalate decarboxylase/phosphoglucose isomerase-like protein (cupin superfamily)